MALQPIKGAVNRRFRPSSYRRNDEVAKETISTYLEANGHTILDSKENFSFAVFLLCAYLALLGLGLSKAWRRSKSRTPIFKA